MSYNMGMPLFDKGFVNFTVEKSLQQFHPIWRRRSRASSTPRAIRWRSRPSPASMPAGIANLSPVATAFPTASCRMSPGYPRSNTIDGNPEVQLDHGRSESGYDFSDNFSSMPSAPIGHKFAKSFENDRLPNQVIATLGSNQPCSATNPNGYNTGSSTANGLSRLARRLSRSPVRRRSRVRRAGPGSGINLQAARHSNRPGRQPVQHSLTNAGPAQLPSPRRGALATCRSLCSPTASGRWKC